MCLQGAHSQTLAVTERGASWGLVSYLGVCLGAATVQISNATHLASSVIKMLGDEVHFWTDAGK